MRLEPQQVHESTYPLLLLEVDSRGAWGYRRVSVATSPNARTGGHPGVVDIRGRRDFSGFDPFPGEAPL